MQECSGGYSERSKVARGNRYSHFGLRLLIGLYVAGAISLVLLLSSKFDVDRLIAIERLDQLTKIVPPEDTVYNIKNATVTFRVPTNAADSVGLPIQPNPTGYITVVLSYFDQNLTVSLRSGSGRICIPRGRASFCTSRCGLF